MRAPFPFALVVGALVASGCGSRQGPRETATSTVEVPRAAADDPEPSSDPPARDPSARPTSFAARLRSCRKLEGESELLLARKTFELGIEAFETADYDQAAESFTKAYESTCSPALLYNLAIALQRGGRNADAVDALERYLETEPSGARSSEVRDLLQKLQAAPHRAN